jgi:serine protease Do
VTLLEACWDRTVVRLEVYLFGFSQCLIEILRLLTQLPLDHISMSMQCNKPRPTVLAAVSWFCLLAATTVALPVWAVSDQEAAFQAALQYTVKIRTIVETPFAGDEKGSLEGAGFLVDRERRWVVTNAHVVTRSPSRVEIAFKGGPFFPVRKVYVDPYLDLAVVEVPKKNLPGKAISASLQCTDIPPVGHPVGAFGHPWALSYTGTRGIVSGVALREGMEWLQTDAALNNGNSGGPLISLISGQVVGINTAMLDMHNAENLNFAVPMKYACRILELLREGKDPSPPDLPVVFFDDDNESGQLKVAAAYFNEESPPLREGDVIQTVAGDPSPIKNATQLISALRGRLDDVTLTVIRDDKPVTVRGHFKPMTPVMQRRGLYLAGALIASPGFRDEPEANLGKLLAVHFVAEGSPANAQGFQLWDLIKSVDGKPFHDIDTLLAYLNHKNQPVQIVVKRLSESNDKIYEYHEFELPLENLGIISTNPS